MAYVENMAPLPTVLEALLAVAVTAGIFDFRWRRIPNRLTFTGTVLGCALNGLAPDGLGWRAAAASVSGLRSPSTLPCTSAGEAYAVRAKRAGDVKLTAAIGAISGPGNWLVIFIVSSLLAGATGLIMTLAAGRWTTTLWNIRLIVSETAHLRAPHHAELAAQ